MIVDFNVLIASENAAAMRNRDKFLADVRVRFDSVVMTSLEDLQRKVIRPASAYWEIVNATQDLDHEIEVITNNCEVFLDVQRERVEEFKRREEERVQASA